MMFNDISCEPSTEVELIKKFKTLKDIIDYVAEHEFVSSSVNTSQSLFDTVAGIYSQLEKSVINLNDTGIYRCTFLGAVINVNEHSATVYDNSMRGRTVSMKIYHAKIDPYTFKITSLI